MTEAPWEQALGDSEDAEKLNTSFIERLNLTIRQGCSYLGRRVLAHARSAACLTDALELLRCHYNFMRRHRGLRFGKELRTPAMQAGLTSRRLSFRDIFTSPLVSGGARKRLSGTSGFSPSFLGGSLWLCAEEVMYAGSSQLFYRASFRWSNAK